MLYEIEGQRGAASSNHELARAGVNAAAGRRWDARFQELRGAIVAGDFTRAIPFEPGFDLVIDRAAVTHNDGPAIRECLFHTWRCMKRDALFIGVDWFSTRHHEYGHGEAAGDPYTRKSYVTGPFVGTGNVHLCDEPHLRELFSRFEVVLLEEKLVRPVTPCDGGQLATWNLVARKPRD